MADVQRVYPVQQTGADPLHHTLILPRPVTQRVVDLFNDLFVP